MDELEGGDEGRVRMTGGSLPTSVSFALEKRVWR